MPCWLPCSSVEKFIDWSTILGAVAHDESEWNDRLTPGPWVTLGPGERHKTQSHNGGVGHEQLYSISRSGCSR